MTSLPTDQIRFIVTYIKRKSAHQPNPENCKGAKENNLNVSLVILISITMLLINSTQTDIILSYYWQHLYWEKKIPVQ